ncbi:hypothetical protein PV326_006575 [Microctonus aethiopoides]|nr:hypothetical protein PV326_006575 [Microctonus aethiopoides]
MATGSEREIEPEKNINNSNLPDVVASMEMLTVDSEISSNSNSSSTSTSSNNTQQTRYQMRKRVSKTAPSEVLNRSLKPKKRSYSTMESDGEIQEYYLDKNIKKKPNTKLETIYEEINCISETSSVISARSFKRLIQFNCDKRTTDAKIKKRKAKVKRVFGSKMKLKSSSISMQSLVKKLNGIRSEIRSTSDD